MPTPKFLKTVITLGYNDATVVSAIKVRFNELGFGPLTPSIPNIGISTVDAIKKFQKSMHLIQDGVIGELTWARLFDVVPNKVVFSPLVSEVLKLAKLQLYVREKTGKNDGIEVEMYQKATGNRKGDSWCMSAVYWLFMTACKTLKHLNPVPKTAGVLDCLNKVKSGKYPNAVVVYIPQSGDQFIMDFGSGKGHTGIVTEVKDNKVVTSEGNTSADPSYAGEDREGNGWFERLRPISTIKCFIRYS